jgi:hypothetical protein
VWHSVYCDCIRASIGFLMADSARWLPDILQPRTISEPDDLLEVIL